MKLSPQQIRVLEHAKNGRPLDSHCRSQSDHGGLHGTVFSLVKRGLLTKEYELTDAGRAAIEAAK